MNSQKLIGDVEVLLRSAGFDGVSSISEGDTVAVAGELGAGRAVFRWIPEHASKVNGVSTSGGGPAPQAPDVRNAVAPSFPGLKELIETNAAMVCRLLDLPPDFLKTAEAHLTR
jgi:hypothetical protein